MDLSLRQLDALRTYHTARRALTLREQIGVATSSPLLPDWLRDNLDETGLAVARAELVEAWNEHKPIDGWEYPDGSPPDDGDWIRLPDDPEALVRFVDEYTMREVGDLAAKCLRELRARLKPAD